MSTFGGTFAALILLWGTIVVTSEPEQLWDGDLQLQELILGAASRAVHVQYSTICECFSVVQSLVCSFYGRRNALYVHWMVIAATSQGPTLAISRLDGSKPPLPSMYVMDIFDSPRGGSTHRNLFHPQSMLFA